MTNPIIAPRLIDGSPTCSGEECPCFVPMNEVDFEPERCHHPVYGWYRPVMINDVCLPGLRRLLAEAREENGKLRNLPAVGGSYVEGTLDGLAQRAQVHIGIEQEKALPDNALIAVLCDTVRLVREWERRVEAGVDARLRYAPAPSGADGAEEKEKE